MNKKILCSILMVCIAVSLMFAGCVTQTQDPVTGNAQGKVSEKTPAFDPWTASVTEKKVTVYMGSPDESDNMSVYFINGGDIPYVSLEEFMGIFEDTYNLTFRADGYKASYVRNDGYSADFDFEKNTVHFIDYNMFIQPPGGSLIDAAGMKDEVKPLFRKDDARSYERYGSEITMPLGEYGIQFLRKDGKYLIPLQTFSDIFMAGYGVCCLYNGEAIIFTGGQLTGGLKEIYYSAPKLERSNELAEFDYNELCFGLDYNYGLKEVHKITTFDDIFKDCGYDQLLKSTNQTLADAALYEFINSHLDDQHSGFLDCSFRSDKENFDEITSEFMEGISSRTYSQKAKEFMKARNKYYPKGIPHYEEVGNTAYITFDAFADEGCEDYYSAPQVDELDNTMRLMQYAYDRITREGSPIKNVVMDLSLNGGGTAYTAVYTIGLFLGEGQISVTDQLTGALSSAHYMLDTNRDHVFDEKDTLAGKGYKFYCIESEASFSCGNLVPNVFKNSNMVTLIGQTSGGGSCVVHHLSTAAGSQIQISGNTRISFIKNGAFYDVDRGAAPDVYIKDPAFIFDRKALTDYINNEIK